MRPMREVMLVMSGKGAAPRGSFGPSGSMEAMVVSVCPWLRGRVCRSYFSGSGLAPALGFGPRRRRSEVPGGDDLSALILRPLAAGNDNRKAGGGATEQNFVPR